MRESIGASIGRWREHRRGHWEEHREVHREWHRNGGGSIAKETRPEHRREHRKGIDRKRENRWAEYTARFPAPVPSQPRSCPHACPFEAFARVASELTRSRAWGWDTGGAGGSHSPSWRCGPDARSARAYECVACGSFRGVGFGLVLVHRRTDPAFVDGDGGQAGQRWLQRHCRRHEGVKSPARPPAPALPAPAPHPSPARSPTPNPNPQPDAPKTLTRAVLVGSWNRDTATATGTRRAVGERSVPNEPCRQARRGPQVDPCPFAPRTNTDYTTPSFAADLVALSQSDNLRHRPVVVVGASLGAPDVHA